MSEPASRPGRYSGTPVAALNAPADTRWFNFGLWDGERSFAEAAESLARAVGQAARIDAGDTVVDVACGHGESSRLWLAGFGAQRVVALELEQGSLRGARQRMPAERGGFDAIVGRAESLPLRDGCSDRVVVVDAAYHFEPRQRFFFEARRCLRSGGRLALADLVLARSPGSGLAKRILGAVGRPAGIPAANLLDPQGYADELRACGFTSIEMEFVEDRVIPGFQGHLRALRRRDRSRGRELRAVALAAEALAFARSRGWLRYAVISAESDGRSPRSTLG